jgi:hypothetical protein
MRAKVEFPRGVELFSNARRMVNSQGLAQGASAREEGTHERTAYFNG